MNDGFYCEKSHTDSNHELYKISIVVPFSSFYALASCIDEMGPFQCDKCEKSFTRKASIREHMKVHIANREKLNCAVCAREGKIQTFCKRSNLVQHCRRAHPDCDLENILQNSVKIPIPRTVHPFKCYICENTYKSRAHLKTHITDVHERREKPMCQGCGKRFRNVWGLRKHAKNTCDSSAQDTEQQHHGRLNPTSVRTETNTKSNTMVEQPMGNTTVKKKRSKNSENKKLKSDLKQKTKSKTTATHSKSMAQTLSIDDFNEDETMLESNTESIGHERDQPKNRHPIVKMISRYATRGTTGTGPVASTSGVQQLLSNSIEKTKRKNKMTESSSSQEKKKNRISETLNGTNDHASDTPNHASINESFEQLDQGFCLIEENVRDSTDEQTTPAGKPLKNSSQKTNADMNADEITTEAPLSMPPADEVVMQRDDYMTIYSNAYSELMEPNLLLDTPKCSCKPEYECGDNCSNRLEYTECNQETCPCGDKCRNSIISKGVTAPKCQRFMTLKKGWGVRACEPIKNGNYLMQYLGEVVTKSEYMRRMETCYRKHTNFYGMQLNANLIIDAHLMGNLSRMINHSCKSVRR